MMTVVELNEIAKKLSDLMPLFTRKLLRPLEKLTKTISSPLQMHTITILRENELITMTELSDEMNISKQQMTPIIDKLIDSGFVQREHDDIDRRSIKISLTSVGINFLDDISKEMTSVMKSKIEGLDGDDINTLNHALDDLCRIIKKIPK